MENAITYRVFGRNALFTDPSTKIGGEKMTLMVPTYQALIGITESIYWKPSIKWVIDKVRIVKPIRTESKGVRTLVYSGGNDLAYYTYLSDVEYQVKAHFEFNYNRKNLERDFNENKHFFISKRCLERGGRRDIFLGVRECPAYVEPCRFGEGAGYYDDCTQKDLGIQFFGFSYPDNNGCGSFQALFWKPIMENGIINFCKPEECSIIRELHRVQKKEFVYEKNFRGTEIENDLFNYTEAEK